MELKFKITEEDYIKFNLYHYENSPSQKKTYNLLRYLVPLLASVPIYAVGTSLFRQAKIYWIVIAILFVVVWIITYPNQHKKLVIKQTEKILQEGDNSSVFGEKTLLIDENSIQVFNDTTHEATSKRNIKDIKVYNDMIIIYLSGFTAHIVPTRYLNEETKRCLLKELETL